MVVVVIVTMKCVCEWVGACTHLVKVTSYLLKLKGLALHISRVYGCPCNLRGIENVGKIIFVSLNLDYSTYGDL